MTERMTAAELHELQRGRGKMASTDGSASPQRAKRRDLEGPIHLAIRDLLETLGLVFHHSPNELDMAGKDAMLAVAKAKARGMRPGWPDFEIVHGGRVCFLEVKAPGGSLSRCQRDTLAALHIAGAIVAVVTSVDGANQALKNWGIA